MSASTKPLLRVLAGETIWPPPFWMMRQAGRHLPEYCATRAQAGSFLALVTTPELAAEVTLQPVRRYGTDGAILFSDILMVPWAMGQPLRMAEGEGPRLEPIRDAEGLARLEPEALRSRAAPIFETVARGRAALEEAGSRTALIGFAGSPFTVACYMVDGRGGSDFAFTRQLAYRDPVFFGRLIRILTEATVEYLLAQVEAGAEALMLFDSWSGLLSPSQFRRWVIEPTAAIRRALAQAAPGVPMIGFPRLAGALFADYAARTGMQGLSMDTHMDPRWAAQQVAPGQALQGNLDPLVLLVGGTALETETRSLLAAMRGRPFIFNLGHGIEKETPIAHVVQMLRLVRGG
ncbi:MAG: uroporphyrinogen decarboxylase [Rhodovarius sp.]|nr:uroporphyrinogen decarboxylase [Rhodovarius sp.]